MVASRNGRNRVRRRRASKTSRCSAVGLLVSVVPLLWGAFLWTTHRSVMNSSNHRIDQAAVDSDRSAGDNGAGGGTIARDMTTKVISHQDNPEWYGWQPEIASKMVCSWRNCFEKEHTCETCRDIPEELGVAPVVPHDWVPDVTMLRRMLVDGHDAQGNPWPPSLSQQVELCEDIGVFGGHSDDNRKMLQHIHAQPLQRTGPKIFCGVYTIQSAHATSIRAIRETWAPMCDGFLAFSTENDPRIPAISLAHAGKEEYGNMWQKVRSIWKFVGEHYLEDFDYFFMGGDDLFVLPQNLRTYVSTLGSPDDTIFAGRRFKGRGTNNYFNSGGAGYTLSRGTLRKLSTEGLNHPGCNPDGHTAMEDVMVAACLRKVFNIGLTDTRDGQDRERFHPFAPGTHLTWEPPKPGQKPDWYEEYNQEWGVKLGVDCCAPDSVSFHYIKKPGMVRHLHALLYECSKEN